MQQKQDTGTAQGRLRISVLDVGQADAILLQDGKRNIMIDVGNDAKDKVGDSGGRQALIKALDKAGVSKIKTVFVTHHHRDHMGNIMYVRGKYGVSNIYDSGYVNNGYKASVALNSDLRAGRYNGQALKAGDTIKIDKNYYIEVLAPGDFLSKKDLKNMNNTSLVLMLHYGSFKMLLTGDAEAPVEDALQQNTALRCRRMCLRWGITAAKHRPIGRSLARLSLNMHSSAAVIFDLQASEQERGGQLNASWREGADDARSRHADGDNRWQKL